MSGDKNDSCTIREIILTKHSKKVSDTVKENTHK